MMQRPVLTIALHFPDTPTDNIRDSIKHFDSWKAVFKAISQGGFDKTHTMIISNLVTSKRERHQVIKADKDRGYWIVEMYKREPLTFPK